MNKAIAWSLFVISTLVGLLSVYQLLFAVWMTAYPFVDNHAWRIRFYERLTVCVVIGVVWGSLILWLLRINNAEKKRRLESTNDTQFSKSH